MAGNYPDGVDGASSNFNPPAEAECPECYSGIDWEWLYCPWCGTRLNPGEWDGDEYIGGSMYDCRRDYEVDRALDSMEAD